MVGCAILFDLYVNTRVQKEGSQGIKLRKAIKRLQNAESPCSADDIFEKIW